MSLPGTSAGIKCMMEGVTHCSQKPRAQAATRYAHRTYANAHACCRPFTTTSNSRQLDAEDPRAASFLHLLQELRAMACKPRFILLENVSGEGSFVGGKEGWGSKAWSLEVAVAEGAEGLMHLPPPVQRCVWVGPRMCTRLLGHAPSCAHEPCAGFLGSSMHGTFVSTLQELGYEVQQFELGPTAFGIPYTRPR